MAVRCFGEFMGTMFLVLLGDGVVANVLLKRSKAAGSGWMVIATGWSMAVLAGVVVAIACGSPDAHINPAVTLALSISSGHFTNLMPFILAQTLGAFTGAALVWLHFLPHWKLTEDASAKLACFCTAPSVPTFAANLLSEIVGTFTLVFVVGAIFSKAVSGSGYGSGVGPIMVAALVWGIGLSLGGTTGYAINPARDLGPRLAHFLLPIAGKGNSDWAYSIVPILGPFIGAGLAGMLLRCAGV